MYNFFIKKLANSDAVGLLIAPLFIQSSDFIFIGDLREKKTTFHLIPKEQEQKHCF